MRIIWQFLFLLTLPGLAAAKEERNPKASMAIEPMRVAIVRGGPNGCDPDCTQWIAANGAITAETPAQFRAVFKKMGQKRFPIFISSPGGNVHAALSIGRMIRKLGLDVAVTKTDPAECHLDKTACDQLSRLQGQRRVPNSVNAFCLSACVFILAGGSGRHVSPFSLVGVHQVLSRRTPTLRRYHVVWRIENGQRREISRTLLSEKRMPQIAELPKADAPIYKSIAAYLKDMGIDQDLQRLLLSTPHEKMLWLTREQLQSTQIMTSPTGGEIFIARIPTHRLGDVVASRAIEQAEPVYLYDFPPFPLSLQDDSEKRLSVTLGLRRPSQTSSIEFAMKMVLDGRTVPHGKVIGYIDVLGEPAHHALPSSYGYRSILIASVWKSVYCKMPKMPDFSVRFEINNGELPVTKLVSQVNGSREFRDFLTRACE